MRQRGVKHKDEIVKSCEAWLAKDPKALRGVWHTVFGNDRPIHLEIGSGKGRFITSLAALHPDINYLACEGGENIYVRILQKAAGHAVWDWDLANHSRAVDFYRELAEENPGCLQPCYYLLDNLLADHRADEAEAVLEKMRAMKGYRPVIGEMYRAHAALARFDEPGADRIIEELVKTHEGDDAALFEAAQYYAAKCDYEKAIAYYERAFEKDPRRPRFQDALLGIASILEIRGDYAGAAATYDRIVDLLENEWGLTEEVELLDARKERDRLLAKAR